MSKGWYCSGPAGGFLVLDRAEIEPAIAKHAQANNCDPDDYTATEVDADDVRELGLAQ